MALWQYHSFHNDPSLDVVSLALTNLVRRLRLFPESDRVSDDSGTSAERVTVFLYRTLL